MTEHHFMITSHFLEKLRPEISKAVSLIKQAVEAKRPIWIRHHTDCDGYCAGVALERALLPLIYERHTRERDIFFYFSRYPSKTPYYDYTDATKDLTNFMNSAAKFESKPPLIILCDIGSSDQNLLSIKKVKIYGAKVIVIDHHPSSPEIEKVTEAHINPHHIGSEYDFSAGMICAEVAKHINPGIDQMEFIASVAGFGDKVASKELEHYFALAKKQGYDEEHIATVAKCLDFEAFTLGYTESRDLISDILGADPTRQKKLLALIKPVVEDLRRAQLETNKKYLRTEEKGDIVICKLEVAKIRQFGSYPTQGAVAGITQDYLVEHYKNKKKPITIGICDDQLNFRCSKQIDDFDVNELIALLKKELPHAQIDGGGHKRAGSIGFVEAAKEEVLVLVEQYLMSVKK